MELSDPITGRCEGGSSPSDCACEIECAGAVAAGDEVGFAAEDGTLGPNDRDEDDECAGACNGGVGAAGSSALSRSELCSEKDGMEGGR